MIIIRDGQVLLDPASHQVEQVDVLIDNETILEIGPPGMMVPEETTEISARHKVLIPGLLNAHTHAHANLFKSNADRWTLELLLNAGARLSRHLNPHHKYLSTVVGAIEMVRKGCTACYDLFYEFSQPTVEGLISIGKAYSDVGMRGVVTPMMADRTFYQAIPGLLDAFPQSLRDQVEGRTTGWQVQIEQVKQTLQQWPFESTHVKLAVAPTIPLHCSDDFFKACVELSQTHGIGIHTHLAESKIQAISGIKRYGKTLTAYLEDLGVLGPWFTAAHAIWIDDEDIKRLAKTGASVAHNPGSNMRLGSGLASVRRMRDLGVNVGIGTDATSCSDNLNMFEAMRLASFTSRVQDHDYERWLTTEAVFTMATEGSAKAMGFPYLGRIAKGFKADIVFLDLDHINYVPLTDITNQLVHAEDATAVDSVMVGGRLVLEQGRLTTLDEAAIRSQVREAVAELKELAGTPQEWTDSLERIVGSFCRSLASQPYRVNRMMQPSS